ncbi:MAG: N-acetyltransferase [Ignavibacteria bacterium]|nr:N-acetyltransferase [Ignavibacteria bacterium]
MIRKALVSDAQGICRIYNHYVENSTVTFETEVVSDELMKDRIERVSANYPWLVIEEDGEILGYAYATRWKERQAYNFTAECAVYVDKCNHAKGIGNGLYSELITECKNAGLHLLIAGIALPNEASLILHEKLGFAYVGKFPEVGKKFGNWIDVGYWTLKLV